ncbi:MAG: hypothetical protein JOZ58_26760 [Acetobacteraceae bacterium]|nr:hypothetical protein [Acetobacteraceae bacterium]
MSTLLVRISSPIEVIERVPYVVGQPTVVVLGQRGAGSAGVEPRRRPAPGPQEGAAALRHRIAQIFERRPDALAHVEDAGIRRYEPKAERVRRGHADKDAPNFDSFGFPPHARLCRAAATRAS